MMRYPDRIINSDPHPGNVIEGITMMNQALTFSVYLCVVVFSDNEADQTRNV